QSISKDHPMTASTIGDTPIRANRYTTSQDVTLPIAAWCDLDADGIKIIDVLERKLHRQLQPVGMDLELWQSTPHRTQETAQVARDKKLAASLAEEGPISLRPLATEIAQYGGSCEQQPIHETVLPALAAQLARLLSASGNA
ncbi:hypothetical protein ABH935_003596, partial [Catenulispora sp. GAS73]|uniref:Wadjet anti-phage system protein JetD domain-containing protein n=1 Tax=Catenulispora sp. GAS73 TaxID=3156269 RepID=UPI003511EB37